MTFKQIGVALMVLAGALQSSGIDQIDREKSIQEKSIAFEVASIRPSGPKSLRGSMGGPGTSGSDRYLFHSATMLDLIIDAWNVDAFQVSSKIPLERDRFDLDVKIPEGTTREQFQIMYQNLLADRFKLKVNVESRQFPAYALAVAKSGFKLKEAVAEDTHSPGPANSSAIHGKDGNKPTPDASTFVVQHALSGGAEIIHVDAHLEPIAVLVKFLPKPDGLPIVDRTGLSGKYNFSLDYAPDNGGGIDAAVPNAPMIFSALQEQLGLQLQKTSAPFEVVEVKSFDRTPSEN